jgi:serine/threonine protein phosphatase 1
VTSILERLLGRLDNRDAAAPRPRLAVTAWPAAVYAIGDSHGCADLLDRLETNIAADASDLVGEKWIVWLGDMIDRGPSSARVVQRALEAPPDGFRRIVLCGNHEQMLLDFLAQPRRDSPWLEFGGMDTLRSYGFRRDRTQTSARQLARDALAVIPQEHLDLLAQLPVALSLPGCLFVHAGVRPGLPLEQQTDEDLMWIRSPFLESGRPADALVIHGHSPSAEPVLAPGRIGVDTGAVFTGRLTAVRLAPAEVPRLLQVRLTPPA